jgi:hypothetical protein
MEWLVSNSSGVMLAAATCGDESADATLPASRGSLLSEPDRSRALRFQAAKGPGGYAGMGSPGAGGKPLIALLAEGCAG